MNAKQIFVTLAMLVMALLVGACASANASEATKVSSQIPEVVIIATDFGFESPAQIEAGLVSLILKNEGQEPHHAQLVRLNDGVSLEQFQAALQESPEAAFPLVAFTGGPGLVDPGLSSQVTLELDPGQYLLLCFMPSHDGVPHLAKGMVKPFEVVAHADHDQSNAAQLKADAVVKLLDFSFILPSEVKAGKQLWQVVNEGPQVHEIMIVKLAEGKTVGDIMAFMHAPAGAPPFVNMGGLQALNPGASGWLNLDLEPGEYVALCHVPDPASGTPHEMMGMALPFSVK
jgi:hypothetical protein